MQRFVLKILREGTTETALRVENKTLVRTVEPVWIPIKKQKWHLENRSIGQKNETAGCILDVAFLVHNVCAKFKTVMLINLMYKDYNILQDS
jgi:hypothetical protein